MTDENNPTGVAQGSTVALREAMERVLDEHEFWTDQHPTTRAELQETIWGTIAAVYGELDDEDCAWIDKVWAKQRGLTIVPAAPVETGVSYEAMDAALAMGRPGIERMVEAIAKETGEKIARRSSADIGDVPLEKLQEFQRLAGIPHLPTQLTYVMRSAVSGEGPRAYDWSDKPHRLVYDLCHAIEHMAAQPQEAPLPIDAIDSMPHPYRPESTEGERKSILHRLELEGEVAISNILFQSALALPGQGSFAGMLWTIGEWVRTRHGTSTLSRPSRGGSDESSR